ncbi:hypothetical protein [Frankia sp. CiP3]|uniref:hypothetical protein n=1 Tax=Frankia sp. CiP3 TaxID=2880971 RepID=UPI001EF5018C|nr:hypothetical protein [Frankia sp. CiP3]
MKKSQLAWDERDGARMLTLAQAVQDGPWTLPASVRSEAAQQEARGHALTTRDLAAVDRKLNEARDLLAASVHEHDMPLRNMSTSARVGWIAERLTALGLDPTTR